MCPQCESEKGKISAMSPQGVLFDFKDFFFLPAEEELSHRTELYVFLFHFFLQRLVKK